MGGGEECLKAGDVWFTAEHFLSEFNSMCSSSSANHLEILVIDIGAIGSGVALNAITSGLRVGLVER
ncbi:hypothetical protein ACOSQ4_003534 [Xanthoceras sorbifolium]